MKPVAVVGLGLMGGSLVRALSAAGRPVRAWSPEPAEVEAAAALPGVEGTSSVRDAAAGTAGVVVAAPLSALRGVLDEILAVPGGGAEWVQDVASLQAPPLDWARSMAIHVRYVSAHPMAGGEASGFSASRDGLYREAPVWLSHSGADAAVMAAAETFWLDLDAHPCWTEAEAHDSKMSLVSHLPQVVATQLAAVLSGAGLRSEELGAGGRDTTRLAGSDPRMWADILELAGGRLAPHLRALAARLHSEAGRLEAGDASRFAEDLKRTREWRSS